MTHRKLTSVIGSTCSLFKATAEPYVEGYDSKALGENILGMMTEGMKNSINFRESLPTQEQFIDIQYDNFVEDPIKTVKLIYDRCNLEFTQEFEEKMKV
jgi:hypothetical protein